MLQPDLHYNWIYADVLLYKEAEGAKVTNKEVTCKVVWIQVSKQTVKDMN